MIEINEKFTVAAPPEEVYAVLSDPYAVVECVQGASLKGQGDDGTYDGAMTVKFSALRVTFNGRVGLELDEENRKGTVTASGRDGQGGTRFQATASFAVHPADLGATSEVEATGEVALSGKLASMIEGAASAVVRRMTGEFVEALSLRCASGATQLGPAAPAPATATPAPAQPVAPPVEAATVKAPVAVVPAPVVVAEPPAATAGVLLLHGFGGSPSGVRGWGQGLAATGAAVSIPRLPGHGTRWKDLRNASAEQWYAAAEGAFRRLRLAHDRVYVMGISLGATLALRLAEALGDQVAGVVAVNPMVTAPAAVPRPLGLMRLVRSSAPAVRNDIRKSGVTDVGYDRVPLRAADQLERLGRVVLTDLPRIVTPVVLVTSETDHVVALGDAGSVWDGLPTDIRRRVVYEESYHLIPLDNDGPALLGLSTELIINGAKP